MQRIAFALVLLGACGNGVRRHPLQLMGSGGTAGMAPSMTGGKGGSTEASGGAAGGGDSAGHGGAAGAGLPSLSGQWEPCGTLGSGGPEDIALSADGQTVVASFANAPVTVFRVSDRKVLRQIAVEGDTRVPVAISPDGSLVATSLPVQVWPVAGGGPIFQLPDTALQLSPASFKFQELVVFSPDSKRLLFHSFVSNTSVPSIYNVATGKVEQSIGAADVAVFTKDGTGVVSHTHDDQRVRFSGTAGAASAVTIPLDEAYAHELSPLGTMIIGYAPSTQPEASSRLQAYHLPEGRLLWTVSMESHLDSLAFSPDERVVVAYGTGIDLSSAQAFDPSTGASLVLPGIGRQPGLQKLAIGPQGKAAIVAASGGIYQLDGDPSDFEPRDSPYPGPDGQRYPIVSIAVSNDGRRLATGSLALDSSAIIWDLPARKLQWALPVFYTSQVAFTADNQSLLRVWDVVDSWSVLTGKREWENSATAEFISGLRWFVASGRMAGSYATNHETGVRIGSTSDVNVRLVVETGRAFSAMAFSPDGKTLATSGPALWRLADGQRIWPPAAPAKQDNLSDYPADNWVAFSPDGSLLLVSDFTASEDWLKDLKSYKTITKLYRTSDGALVRDLGTGLSRRPNFSPDGAWIVAGSVLYPVLSGAPMILRPMPVDSVSTFAPDGTVAAGGIDGITRLFCPQ